MRALLLAALLSVTLGAAAFADESVAGNWRANLGSGVTIDMKVTADGKWTSKTLEHKKLIRRIEGTYTQQPSNSESGTLVFTPTKFSGPKDSVQVETDQYEIAENGRQLKLTTEGDTMVFEKHGKH